MQSNSIVNTYRINKALLSVSVCICILVFQSGFNKLYSQDRIEIGGFVGASYYLGDLNPSKQFNNSSLALGGVGRYVIDDRYAVKGSLTMARLKGSYHENDIVFPEGNVEYSFDRPIGDAAIQLEFNFLSYDHWFDKNSNWTPYVSVGLGTTAYKRFGTEPENYSEETVFILSLPFGAGLKYKLNNRFRVGLEWSFRKTFVDDLDVVGHNLPINPNDPYGFGSNNGVHNNDWYSFAGVMVTYSMFKRKGQCNGGFKR
ncbi:DUF6089 family protein [Saccharicrinis aurantiacus]|uniref:type IX secretion system protein PorG n=1 Tax=Saccharicrinis aurantiacus TaxID=1849719 RepID=UPI0024913C55|nr:DUF6089 family protein [Saccharicrinis aurantiacus]